MDQKQWKQNQRIQNRNIYNKRIKRAFLPVTSGLLALMVMVSGCALPGNSGQDTGTQAAADTDESAVVDYTCIANEGSQEKIYVILKNYHGDYWKKVIQGVTKAAEQIDEAVYLGGIDNETDVSGQISLIEKAQQQGADGILLAPANSNALVESCQKINLLYDRKYGSRPDSSQRNAGHAFRAGKHRPGPPGGRNPSVL